MSLPDLIVKSKGRPHGHTTHTVFLRNTNNIGNSTSSSAQQYLSTRTSVPCYFKTRRQFVRNRTALHSVCANCDCVPLKCHSINNNFNKMKYNLHLNTPTYNLIQHPHLYVIECQYIIVTHFQ